MLNGEKKIQRIVVIGYFGIQSQWKCIHCEDPPIYPTFFEKTIGATLGIKAKVAPNNDYKNEEADL